MNEYFYDECLAIDSYYEMYENDILSKMSDIYEAFDNNEISYGEGCLLLERTNKLYCEAVNDRAAKILDKLTEIKETAPTQYTGDEHVKAWVDKNYDKLKDICEYLIKGSQPTDEEQAEYSFKYLASVGLMFGGIILSFMGACVEAEAAALTGFIILIFGLFKLIIEGSEYCAKLIKARELDKQSCTKLSQVKKILQRLRGKKITDDVNDKIDRMITMIEEVEDIEKERLAAEEYLRQREDARRDAARKEYNDQRRHEELMRAMRDK